MKAPPLSGALEQPRVKTYAARNGYVFEYKFGGRRDLKRGTEYVFQVSADRQNDRAVSVMLAGNVLRAWMDSHRGLKDAERYGIAKMALFQAFDQCQAPGELKARVTPDLEQVTEICRTLDLP